MLPPSPGARVLNLFLADDYSCCFFLVLGSGWVVVNARTPAVAAGTSDQMRKETHTKQILVFV